MASRYSSFTGKALSDYPSAPDRQDLLNYLTAARQNFSGQINVLVRKYRGYPKDCALLKMLKTIAHSSFSTGVPWSAVVLGDVWYKW